MTKIIQMPSISISNEGVTTLSEVYRDYIELKSSILSPSTIRGYLAYMRNLFQELMPLNIYSLNNITIQKAVNRYAINHSPKTVRNAYGLLHSILQVYYPEFEPKITLPQNIKPQYVLPTTDTINTLLFFADDRIKFPILLAAQGGLRRSEIAALQLSDFSDFGVNINKAVVYNSDLELVIKTTKTISGTRFVPLSPSLIKMARNYKYFGINPNSISNSFYKLVLKTGVPAFNFHMLRHYFASELHAHNIPDKYIATIGGWSSTSVLQNIYQHTLKDKQSEYEKQITDIFFQNFG